MGGRRRKRRESRITTASPGISHWKIDHSHQVSRRRGNEIAEWSPADRLVNENMFVLLLETWNSPPNRFDKAKFACSAVIETCIRRRRRRRVGRRELGLWTLVVSVDRRLENDLGRRTRRRASRFVVSWRNNAQNRVFGARMDHRGSYFKVLSPSGHQETDRKRRRKLGSVRFISCHVLESFKTGPTFVGAQIRQVVIRHCRDRFGCEEIV